MSGNSGSQFSSLVQRAKAVHTRTTRLVTVWDRLTSDLKAKEAEVERLGKEIEILNKVVELFRLLMDKMIDRQVKTVEKISTEGLQAIFHDLDLSLEAEVAPKYNKISIEFFLRRGAKDNPLSHRGKPLESFGGGPSSVVSLIFRVLAVKKLKLWPVLILDESLGAVSDEYIDLAGQFLKKLSETLGFDILLVTHKAAFLDHAHVSYRCSEVKEADGVSWLELR